MSDYPMLISNKLHSFRNFWMQRYKKCHEIHNLPTKKWQGSVIFDVFVSQMQVIC